MPDDERIEEVLAARQAGNKTALCVQTFKLVFFNVNCVLKLGGSSGACIPPEHMTEPSRRYVAEVQLGACVTNYQPAGDLAHMNTSHLAARTTTTCKPVH